MEKRSLSFIATGCGGELLQGNPAQPVLRVCTDSRQVQPGDLFVSLTGERFDAHAFLPQVIEAGVGAVLVERGKVPAAPPACGIIVVDNCRHALGQLAARYRQDFDIPVIAVAGSNGKTTTKEILATVLSQQGATLKSEASFNNDVGVPTTLLNLEASHQRAVLEVGTNHPGELAPLVRMIQPRFGIITSLGREHLEFFHDLVGVAEEEGWLAELLPADGLLLVNQDSPEIERVIRRARAKVIRVGWSAQADWQVTSLQLTESGSVFTLRAPDAAFCRTFELPLLGRHQVINATFAMVVARELGLSVAQVEQGLKRCQPPKMRLNLWQVNGVRVLDDAYNANADSMAAALQTLCDLPCAGRRIAVLGDMAELGTTSEEAHAEVGRKAARLGVHHLVAVGKMAGTIAAAARQAGLTAISESPGVEAAAAMVRAYVRAGDLVLLKASRSTRLERIGEALRATNN